MSKSSPPPSLLDRLRRFDPTVLPIVVAALVLIGAVVWLLGRPLPQPTAAAPDPQVAALRAEVERLTALNGRVAALEGTAQRLAALEARPAPQAPDLAPLREAAAAASARAEAAERRAAALEERLTTTAREFSARPQLDPDSFAPRAAVEQLGGRVEAIQRELQSADAQAAQRQAAAEGALGALTGRLGAAEAALNARAQATEAQAGRIGQVEQALSARVAQLEQALTGRIGNVEQSVAQRIAALEGQIQQRAQATEQLAQRIGALEGAAQRLSALEGRSARMAALDAVRTALEAGQPLGGPLGTLQNPPAALTRFASAAPPTEAQLRLSFEEAARAGRAASEPQGGTGVMESAASRLSGLVTVRRGEEMLWGDAAGAEIERARRAVEAGDLEGALRFLSRLSPQARQAMSGWIGQAEALVAARQAIRQMAAG